MDKDSESFFRDGVAKFAEARATVAAYEDVARLKVAEVVREKAGRLWGKAGKVEVLKHRFGRGDDDGHVAYAHVLGTFPGAKVTWELGIWWAHPEDGDQVWVYVQCREGPAQLKEKWAVTPKGSNDEWDSYERGLSVCWTPGEAIEDTFTRLIDEAASQLKVLAKS